MEQQTFAASPAATAPIVLRIQALWQRMRSTVIDLFPEAPGLPRRPDAYLKVVDEIYSSDAYHCLSIEGYVVTAELIARPLGRLEPRLT